MPTDIAGALVVVGRFLLGAHYAYTACLNLGNFATLAGRLTANSLPQAKAALAIGLVLEVIGGVMVALSVWPAIGAVVLIAFTVLATPLYHNFWAYAGEERKRHLFQWRTNLALTGAFLLVIATA